MSSKASLGRALRGAFAIALVGVASGCIRGDTDSDAGILSASVQDLNGELALPGVPIDVTPNAIATSQKLLIRSEATNGPPNCLYGVYASDARYLPGGSLGSQPNNGVLFVALANNAVLNADPLLGGQGRTDCPDPVTYRFGDGGVGGAIPDSIGIGDTLQVSGELTPYCDSYDKQASACATPIFPEFTVSSVQDLGGGPSPTPTPVSVEAIEDGTDSAVDYAGMLVQVSNVVTIAAGVDSSGSLVVQAQGADGGIVTSGLWITPGTTTVTFAEVPGQVFSRVTGNLHFITGHWRLEPRLLGDVVAQ